MRSRLQKMRPRYYDNVYDIVYVERRALASADKPRLLLANLRHEPPPTVSQQSVVASL
jgi:hypothetical protein